jgi:hypothetical protein
MYIQASVLPVQAFGFMRITYVKLREFQQVELNLKIFKIWSISESPGNKGSPLTISANMHPTDHISIGVEYHLDPNNISGDLYHSVTTY